MRTAPDAESDLDVENTDEAAEALEDHADAKRLRPRVQRTIGETQGMYGAIPAEAVAWGLRRLTAAQKWERVSFPDPTSPIRRETWPMSELSDKTIQARWGEGRYRVDWYRAGAAGGVQYMTHGRAFTVEPQAAPPPLPGAPPSALDALQPAVQLMTLIEGRANSQVSNLLQAAALFAQRPNENAELAAIREELRALRAERAARADDEREGAVRAEIAALRAELVERDDETPSAVGEVARAAAPLFRPGKPVKDALIAAGANWAASNPEKALGVIMGLLGAAAEALKSAQPAPERPRIVRPAPAAAAPAPAPPPPPPGLNGHLSQAAARESVPPAPAAPAAGTAS